MGEWVCGRVSGSGAIGSPVGCGDFATLLLGEFFSHFDIFTPVDLDIRILLGWSRFGGRFVLVFLLLFLWMLELQYLYSHNYVPVCRAKYRQRSPISTKSDRNVQDTNVTDLAIYWFTTY